MGTRTAILCLAAALGAQTVLGPKDGRNLPTADLNRVQAGQQAPDFTLESRTGETVTLSQFRGRQRVVLVFYRGQW